MIDTLRKFESAALKRDMLKKLDLLPAVTRGDAASTGQCRCTRSSFGTADPPGRNLGIDPACVFGPPRTAARIEASGIKLANNRNFQILPPLGYTRLLVPDSQARLILTDSGGLQEEATALGVPCLTLRPNTERPITVDQGSSRLVGNDWDLMEHLVESILEGQFAASVCPAIWTAKQASASQTCSLSGWVSNKPFPPPDWHLLEFHAASKQQPFPSGFGHPFGLRTCLHQANVASRP